MGRITSKTGGLFNLKEMAKAKEKRQIIGRILDHLRQGCRDQGIPEHLFEEGWNNSRQNKSLSELKKELKLLDSIKPKID